MGGCARGERSCAVGWRPGCRFAVVSSSVPDARSLLAQQGPLRRDTRALSEEKH